MEKDNYNWIIENLPALGKLELTESMVLSMPKIDIHVHLPGTISPQTAWQLGVRNKFINISDGKWELGSETLSLNDPHEHYTDIFQNSKDITLNANGLPVHLDYNITADSFKSFDAIMATVQGHRHPPGGIQNEDDLYFVFQQYLADCIEHNIFYVEVQQNIKIAHQIYPTLNLKQAREKLYKFFERMVTEYKDQGVHIRFLHCFNKTQTASTDQTARERALEAAEWLEEAQHFSNGAFVGVEAAGHEKDESGWPIHLKEGYDAVKALGLGCEAHGGEGIGFEHMLDVARILPVTRIAHGFQVIENEAAIAEIKERNIILVMSPIINLNLGACISVINNGEKHKKYIRELSEHPFFTLLRKHKMNITLCSDNPQMAGVPLQELIKSLSGLNDNYSFGEDAKPMATDELVMCMINGIKAAFCEETIKQQYIDKLAKWCEDLLSN